MLNPRSSEDREAQDEQIYQYLAERYGLGYLLHSTKCTIAYDGSAQVIRNVTVEAYSEVSSIDSFIRIPEEGPDGVPTKIAPGNLKSFDYHKLDWKPVERIAGKFRAKITIEPPLQPGETLKYQILESKLPTGLYAIDKTQAEIEARENPIDYWGWQITRPTKRLVLEVVFPFGSRPANCEIGVYHAISPGVADEHYPPKALLDIQNAEVTINDFDDSFYKEFDYPVFNMIYSLRWKPKAKEVQLSETDSSKAPILIVTATKIEAQAVLKVFSTTASKARKNVAGKTYYLLATVNNTPIYMVQSEMGAVAVGGALVTTQNAIHNLHPQSVILCGIAFGLRPKSQKMGDILVARQLMNYEPAKVDRDKGTIQRGDRPTASEKLIDQFRSEDLDWKGPQIHFGLMLSGEKLVNDPVFRDHLLETEPEAIGGEMEAAGLYAAAHNANVDWIMVKAICDWGDGNKDDTAQALAAKNAATFVHHVLRHNV